MKAREFWIGSSDIDYTEAFVSDTDPKLLSDCDDFMNMKTRPCIHVEEIIPGTITLTRSEFRAAFCETAFGEPDYEIRNEELIFGINLPLLEERLFGPADEAGG